MEVSSLPPWEGQARISDAVPSLVPTIMRTALPNTGCMDEPTHAFENQFWDLVADWLLEPHGMDAHSPSIAELKARLLDRKGGQDYL
jgi:hypothetical protein